VLRYSSCCQGVYALFQVLAELVLPVCELSAASEVVSERRSDRIDDLATHPMAYSSSRECKPGAKEAVRGTSNENWSSTIICISCSLAHH
jgi:hypothetical protein